MTKYYISMIRTGNRAIKKSQEHIKGRSLLDFPLLLMESYREVESIYIIENLMAPLTLTWCCKVH